jgi:excisionase family DNA binding protein
VVDVIPVIGYNFPEAACMYSTKQAAQRLGLSQDHVRLLARKGIIEARKLGHDWLVLHLNYTRKREPKRGKQ